jgi:hypothetical protein
MYSVVEESTRHSGSWIALRSTTFTPMRGLHSLPSLPLDSHVQHALVILYMYSYGSARCISMILKVRSRLFRALLLSKLFIFYLRQRPSAIFILIDMKMTPTHLFVPFLYPSGATSQSLIMVERFIF